MTDLSEEEKARVIQTAIEHIMPIAEKHELDYPGGINALTEAFQAGIKVAVKEVKDIGHGTGS